MDEEEVDQPNGAVKESPTDKNAKVEEGKDADGDIGDVNDEGPAPGDIQPEPPLADSIKNLGDDVAERNTVAPVPTQESESVPANQDLPGSSGMQIIGDLGGNWKAVMHERSNQCYYWNTVTGETSWETPNGLVLGGVTTDGITSLPIGGQMDYTVEAQTHVLHHNAVAGYPSVGTYGNFEMECGSGQITQDPYTYTAVVSSNEPTDIDSVQLIKYGENLLQRLKLLERHSTPLGDLEWINREIEIRVSDCNALSSYGSSLLPLWLHTEMKLKQLESFISKVEASYLTESKHEKTGAGAESKDSSKEESLLQNTVAVLQVVEKYDVPNDAEVIAPSLGKDSKSESHSELPVDENVKSEDLLSKSSVQNLEVEREPEVSVVKVEPHVEDDMDMDVEMEVDEDNIEGQGFPSAISTSEPLPMGQVESSNFSSSGCPSTPPKDTDSPPPPPPEEDWIPPPPPENEPSPPPPPEEPTVSYAYNAAIPASYLGQSNFPATEYYASASSDGTDVNYYAQSSGSHILEPQPPSYVVPVSATVISASADITPIDPLSYYSIPAVVPPAPVVSTGISGYYASSMAASCNDTLDNRTTGVSVTSENSTSAPVKLESASATVSAKPEELFAKEVSVTSTSQALGSISAVGSTSDSLTISKNQTKVVRSKKRVAVSSSLRSNKKVSSLVDKWKAAKEELRSVEEEEPESVYEAVERKRQKEIDEWRAHQIASGEAQVNANFVPLGSDWRERVKRRRAESKSELRHARTETVEHKNGHPDLTELSKDLPSGWQAYWDESSKQVYYGNSITSETTWTKPAR